MIISIQSHAMQATLPSDIHYITVISVTEIQRELKLLYLKSMVSSCRYPLLYRINVKTTYIFPRQKVNEYCSKFSIYNVLDFLTLSFSYPTNLYSSYFLSQNSQISPLTSIFASIEHISINKQCTVHVDQSKIVTRDTSITEGHWNMCQ